MPANTTPACWDAVEISRMSEEQNLRNLCRQLEQEYVEWHRRATYDGYLIARSWPAIGELGRYTVKGEVVRFVTTRKRSIEVQSPEGNVLGEFKMLPGLAQELYVCAGQLLDLPDHCQANGNPCVCELCVRRTRA